MKVISYQKILNSSLVEECIKSAPQVEKCSLLIKNWRKTMKREHKKHYDPLWRCYPLFFWKECCMCGKDFRREWGWRALTGPYCWGQGVVRYLCSSCAPTKEKAAEIFLKDKWMSIHPSLPRGRIKRKGKQ